MILKNLGIYGWKETDENLALASLLTGDPLLMIGSHGCAKTLVAGKMAQALGKRFIVYDASKAMFEDVLGYPNLEKLKQGQVEYVASRVTIWDKEFILIDELSRALPELQSKWLEIIRSRKIMGLKTQVKWVWSAMNPMSYCATQALDEALVGRFAIFLYPPDVLQMSEEDRIQVTVHINGEDAPSLGEWLDENNEEKSLGAKIDPTAANLTPLFSRAAGHFAALRGELVGLSEFLAKFADLLARETKGELALDGRRLGFIYRNILAVRAIELAKAGFFGEPLASFADSARCVVQSSIPMGLSEESIQREEALHKLEICFDLLAGYFEPGSPMERTNMVYELFTTPDLMRKAQILMTQDLSELAKTKAWTDLTNGEGDITLLAYVALQIEARRPGTVPGELLETLSRRIAGERLSTDCIPELKRESLEYIEEVETLLARDSDLERLIAYGRVQELARKGGITPRGIEETRRLIEQDLAAFEKLLEAGRGKAHEDLQTVA